MSTQNNYNPQINSVSSQGSSVLQNLMRQKYQVNESNSTQTLSETVPSEQVSNTQQISAPQMVFEDDEEEQSKLNLLQALCLARVEPENLNFRVRKR